jgi:hypothetical protein
MLPIAPPTGVPGGEDLYMGNLRGDLVALPMIGTRLISNPSQTRWDILKGNVSLIHRSDMSIVSPQWGRGNLHLIRPKERVLQSDSCRVELSAC